jgi:hypothetical protein
LRTKRILALGLCAMLALSVTGCTRQVKTAEPAGSPTATATPPSVDVTSEPTTASGVTVGPPDSAGNRTYQDAKGRYVLTFPQAWAPSQPQTAGPYPSVEFRTEEPSAAASPVLIQFVDNPEKFSPEAILRNKWKPAPVAEITTTKIGGVDIVEARVQLKTKRGKPLYVYEAARTFTTTFAIAHVEGSDKKAVDTAAASTREVLASLKQTSD